LSKTRLIFTKIKYFIVTNTSPKSNLTKTPKNYF
jgi:hypothetical protein